MTKVTLYEGEKKIQHDLATTPLEVLHDSGLLVFVKATSSGLRIWTDGPSAVETEERGERSTISIAARTLVPA